MFEPKTGPAKKNENLFPDVRASAEGIEHSPAEIDIQRVIRTALSDARLGMLREKRFNNLPWDHVKTEIELGESVKNDGRVPFVRLIIERLDPSDESTRLAFCGGMQPNGEGELAGTHLNQLAGLLKFRIGQEHERIYGSDHHSFRVIIEFENYQRERYFYLWDLVYKAVEQTGEKGSAVFFIAAPHEIGVIQRFLSHFQEMQIEGKGQENAQRPLAAFRYRIPRNNHRCQRIEEVYPKKIYLDRERSEKSYMLPEGAEICPFLPAFGGTRKVPLKQSEHSAPRAKREDQIEGHGRMKPEQLAVQEPKASAKEASLLIQPDRTIVAKKGSFSDFLPAGGAADLVYKELLQAGLMSTIKALDDFVSSSCRIAHTLGISHDDFETAIGLALDRLLESYGDDMIDTPGDIDGIAKSIRTSFANLMTIMKDKALSSSAEQYLALLGGDETEADPLTGPH